MSDVSNQAAEQTATLQVQGLSKRYSGNQVLQDISLEVPAGEVFALTGPNGAGKTTLIRCLTGLAFPTSGTVRLCGINVHERGRQARAHLGAVVEAPARFYPLDTGLQNLRTHAALAGLAGQAVGEDRVQEVLALLELTSVAERPLYSYSLGQRQRLGVAAAILGRPALLMLDEPTSGLDPLGIGLIHRIVTDLAQAGSAVVLSTHHLREIAGYASRVGILSGGRMVDIVDMSVRRAAYRLRVSDPRGAVRLLQQQGVGAHVRSPYVIMNLGGEDLSELLGLLLRSGQRVEEMAPDLFDLHDYYRERVQA